MTERKKYKKALKRAQKASNRQKHRKTKIRNPSVRAVLAMLFSSKFGCFMNGLLLFCALQRAMRFRRHSGCRDMSNEELGGIRFSSQAPSLPNSGYFCLEPSRAHSLSSVKEMQSLFFQCPNNSSQNLLNDNQARKNIGFIKLTAFNISASMLRACLGCHIWD